MQLSFRRFQVINLVVIVSLLLAAIHQGMARGGIIFTVVIWVGLILLWLPVMLFMKTRITEFQGMPFSKIVFATPGTLTGHTGLGKRIDRWWKEPKRTDAAEIWPRIVAYLIDSAIIVVVIVVTALATLMLKAINWLSDIDLIIILSAIITAVLLYLFLRDGWQGQGIGKRIMHIQVVRFSTGKSCGYGRSALRYLCLRAFGIVELIILCVQPNHRRIGDWMSDTIVIKK